MNCCIYIDPWEPKTFIFRGYNPYIGGKIGGKTPKWIVKRMENSLKKWDALGGKPLFFETPI